ncbi:hypothetical protein ABZ016_15185 [Streptomyces sp. NPDC006372]|uniref:hypothetical protein n=1 Tax=Streptomyces sp. NPDC006372 TaxID=3155599 RepID=UPI0033AF8A52
MVFPCDHEHARSIREEGVIRTATGDGRVAFVDADDIAAVAVHALTADRDVGGDLVLTGRPPRSLRAHVERAMTAVDGWGGRDGGPERRTT